MDLITADEHATLTKRLNDLIANRLVLSARIDEARQHGDLKENAEYHTVRELQGMDEAEIRRIEHRLTTAHIVDSGAGAEAGVVFIGTTVKLREVGTDEDELFRLVGEASGEVDDEIVEVTTGSPMGEALMKARVGEVVAVRAPRGVKKFEIIEIL